MSSSIQLFDLIGELARLRYHAADRHFAALHLNHTEARLLSVLQRQGGAASQDVLSGALTVDRSNAVRALQHLQSAGYIRRKRDRADKRANLIQITAKGRKKVAAISRIRKKMARELFGKLTKKQADVAARLLRRVVPEPGQRRVTV
jgi:DNA-binding MarR family transcriptional regulator